MASPSFRSLAPVLVLSAAVTFSGCLARRLDPQVSQAVLDARAGKDAPAEDCAAKSLETVSPTVARFPFGEANIPTSAETALGAAAAWLACHPTTTVAVLGEADPHGAPEQRADLARRRAQAAAGWLQQHGVAARRIRILAAGETPGVGTLVVQAEGRRW